MLPSKAPQSPSSWAGRGSADGALETPGEEGLEILGGRLGPLPHVLVMGVQADLHQTAHAVAVEDPEAPRQVSEAQQRFPPHHGVAVPGELGTTALGPLPVVRLVGNLQNDALELDGIVPFDRRIEAALERPLRPRATAAFHARFYRRSTAGHRGAFSFTDGKLWPGRPDMFETLFTKVDGAIGHLTLNRPKKLNPLSTATLRELADAARWFDEQPEVRVVIVGGAGRAFSAGADLDSFQGSQQGSTREAADVGRQMAEALENMRALSIAAIQGWCVGGGVVLAAACDLRVAAEDARFSIPEVDLGIPLAWGGIPRLVREIGPALTKELVLTCRPFHAAEAKAAGFLNRLVPADELEATVLALARSLAVKAPHALFSTKRHVNAVTDQMVGTMRSWSDADGLATAFTDPECAAARREYLRARRPES
jgi:enoyl-CoA hydratase/carnithine racemase